MKRAASLVAVSVAVLLSASGQTRADKWTKGRMSLFISARTLEPPPAADAKGLKIAYDAAEKQLKSLEQDLKKRHGGKREQWPEDARASFAQASGARRQALNRWLDSLQTQEALEKGTEAFQKIILGKSVEHTTRATSPEDADLTVEVIRVPTREHDSYSLRIAPGGRVDPSRLGGTTFEWRSANVSEVHAFTPAEPYWEIQAMGGTFHAHAYASSGLGGFIRQYFEVLAAARKQP